jgi:hypothetical protein
VVLAKTTRAYPPPLRPSRSCKGAEPLIACGNGQWAAPPDGSDNGNRQYAERMAGSSRQIADSRPISRCGLIDNTQHAERMSGVYKPDIRTNCSSYTRPLPATYG